DLGSLQFASLAKREGPGVHGHTAGFAWAIANNGVT
ncbi:hypothetical protein P3T43_007041, partial [Paraburkholderia sp. GAS41]